MCTFVIILFAPYNIFVRYLFCICGKVEIPVNPNVHITPMIQIPEDSIPEEQALRVPRGSTIVQCDFHKNISYGPAHTFQIDVHKKCTFRDDKIEGVSNQCTFLSLNVHLFIR